jgi:hypothetical protein
MGKGYAEGPAAEAAEEERERLAGGGRPATVARATRRAVFGSTREQPEPHVIGWADEVDVDALFASGAAWGLHVRSVASG